MKKQDSIPLDATAQLRDSTAWSVVNAIIKQRAVDQNQTRDKRKVNSHEKRKSRKQPRQTPTPEANQIANTFSRQHDTSYIKQRNWEIRLNSGHCSYQNWRHWRAHRTRQQNKCERDGRVPIQSHKTQIKGNQRTRSKQRYIEVSPIWSGS